MRLANAGIGRDPPIEIFIEYLSQHAKNVCPICPLTAHTMARFPVRLAHRGPIAFTPI